MCAYFKECTDVGIYLFIDLSRVEGCQIFVTPLNTLVV